MYEYNKWESFQCMITHDQIPGLSRAISFVRRRF